MVDRITPASRREAHYDESTGAEQPPPRRLSAPVGQAIDAQIDAALAEFARNANDALLHIGINRSSARAEVAALSKFGPVTELQHGPRDATIIIDGNVYDLRDATGRERFIGLLRSEGLSEMHATIVAATISETNPTGLDEMAHLALLWAKGERGEAVPSRIVISGHSSGETVWDGEGDGEIRFADIQRLARVMPRAAAQVEDIHISACSTGGQAAIAENRAAWLDAFPNLKTMWAYDGAAPHAGGTHLTDWAQATRGRNDRLELTKNRAAAHIGVWDRPSGYRDGAEPLAAVRVRQGTADARYDAWVSGERRPQGTDDLALVADYRTYRALAGRSDLPKAEREMFRLKADALLRVRYFDGAVRREIDRRYGARLGEAFASVGLAPPRFTTMSLGEMRAELGRFERAARPAMNDDLALVRALGSLDSDVLPSSWCRH